MKRLILTKSVRTAAAVLLAFSLAAGATACGSKDTAGSGVSGNGSGSTGTESAGSSGGGLGTADGSGNVFGSGQEGGGQRSSESDAVGQAAQGFASQYGIDMPDGIVSLADPNAIYDAGSMIQMSGIELYVEAEEASDWIDTTSGLSNGMKYISVELELTDYGAGTVKEIPAPEHYYLIEAKDEFGNALDLNAAGASGGMLRPVTDMPAAEIREDADEYYCAAEPYRGDDMDRWLLYRVPEGTREAVLACWLTDQFSQPHNAAFRLKVKEKHESHTFEHMEADEIRRLLETSERPELEDFGWYTAPTVFAERAAGTYRDPEYDAREYLGGWKCYIFRDARAAGRGFEAHLCNLFVENYQPGDEYEKGWVDVRIDWYLAIDGEGHVTDESGLPDTVCPHEEFYYNRMENDDGSYPFASFSFEYMQDAAAGRGRYVTENKEEYTMAVVRAGGKKLWILDGSRPALTVMPGTQDVPVPASLLATASAAGDIGSNSSQTGNTQSGISQNSAETGFAQSGPTDAGTSSGFTDTALQGLPEEATLDDFSWYFDDDFPIDGKVLSELQDLGGDWKGLLNVVTPKDGEDQCRILVCSAEVRYMGYKVTVLLNPKETHEFMVSNPGNIKTEQVNTAGNIVLNGDWVDDPGYIDVTSETSALNLLIYDFVEAGGRQYASGTVYNGETEIGEIALVRP